MNKELEEAIKTVRKFNQENRYRDCGKINNSIDMVLQALESYQIKELQFLNNKLDNISATELQTILQPYYIQQESLKHKDKIINELKNKLENSIPKEVIEKEIEELGKIAKKADMIPETVKEERIDGSYVYSQRFNADGYIAEVVIKVLKKLLEGK